MSKSGLDAQAAFVELIRGFASEAISAGNLPKHEDPVQLAFELNGIISQPTSALSSTAPRRPSRSRAER